MRTRRIATLLSALLLTAAVLTACGRSSPVILRCDLPAAPRSLDPQFADPDDAQGQFVLANLFEGLVRPAKEGGVQPACAESWSVSADGLVYTFTLREGLLWADGGALTASDFAFGLQRMFLPPNPSPNAAFYRSIANADAVMAGEAPPEALGVAAPDDRTLTVTLCEPNAQFLTLLARPAAAPCSRAFFEEQRGRYGLERRLLLTNGPFLLSAWSETAVRLRKSEHFRAPAAIDGVDLTVCADAEARCLAGETDICLFTGMLAQEQGLSGEWIRDRSWALLLNPASAACADEGLRRALISALTEDALAGRLSPPAEAAQGLISPAFFVAGIPYRETAGPTRPPQRDPDARAALRASLERLELPRFPKAALLVCADGAGDRIGAALLQNWSDALSAYINLETADYNTLLARVRSGRFDLALAPLPTDAGDRTAGLRLFEDLSAEEGGLAQALAALGGQSAAEEVRLLAEAEQAVIDACLALPVCDTPSLFYCREGISGVWCESATHIVYFADARVS